jgi:hypothetical protein
MTSLRKPDACRRLAAELEEAPPDESEGRKSLGIPVGEGFVDRRR